MHVNCKLALHEIQNLRPTRFTVTTLVIGETLVRELKDS